jgi:hypothetical protein
LQFSQSLFYCNYNYQPELLLGQAISLHSYVRGPHACVAARRNHKSKNKNVMDRAVKQLALFSLTLRLEIVTNYSPFKEENVLLKTTNRNVIVPVCFICICTTPCA